LLFLVLRDQDAGGPAVMHLKFLWRRQRSPQVWSSILQMASGIPAGEPAAQPGEEDVDHEPEKGQDEQAGEELRHLDER
jgi:hypothetical protein